MCLNQHVKEWTLKRLHLGWFISISLYYLSIGCECPDEEAVEVVVVVAVITLGCQWWWWCQVGGGQVPGGGLVPVYTGPGPGRGWGGLCSVGQCGLQGEHSGHCQVSTSPRNWTCEEHSLSHLANLQQQLNMLPDL